MYIYNYSKFIEIVGSHHNNYSNITANTIFIFLVVVSNTEMGAHLLKKWAKSTILTLCSILNL